MNSRILNKIVDSISWVLAEKLIRLICGFWISIWVARYLGPEQFGLLNVGLAWAGLFAILGSLGLPSILVRELVARRGEERLLLGTSLAIQVAGSCLGFAGTVSLAWITNGANEQFIITAWAGLTIFSRIGGSFRAWFESQTSLRIVAWVDSFVYLIVSLSKLVLIVLDAPLLHFAMLFAIEGLLLPLALWVAYSQRAHGAPVWSWVAKRRHACLLLGQSWPLVMSGIAISLYMNSDKIMLGYIIGEAAVGEYAAAARITSVLYFVPTVIATAVMPTLIQIREQRPEKYDVWVQRFFDLVGFIAVLIALPIYLAAGWIVDIAYGEQYLDAVVILQVHVWGLLFNFIGVANARWFVIEKMQKSLFYRALIGAVVNIVLNYFLIPRYGAPGAAFATVMSYACANLVSLVFSERTRKVFFMSVSPYLVFPVLKRLIHSNIHRGRGEW